MEYFLYWGCSLEASAKHYLVSINAIGKALDIHFKEIEDWNCCGASISYIGGNELSVDILAARNLALAEAQGGLDIVAPCSSCYVILNRVNREFQQDPEHLKTVNEILAESNLRYSGKLKIRHILDVLVNDVGLGRIKSSVKKPLNGVKVAGYVGCQTVRPYGEYDSKESPISMDALITVLGAEAVKFPTKMRCCGSGIFFTEPEAGYELVDCILGDAIAHGGRIVATACPMCQMNLEVYQRKINKARGTNYDIPVVFITQLMALAFGLDAKEGAALNYNIIPPETALSAAVA
jgi:heterodisulfide reductase subunit B